MQKRPAVSKRLITRWQASQEERTAQDHLIVEEPLTVFWKAQSRSAESVALTSTMRTPGQDFELAAGLLFTEGLVDGPAEIEQLRFCQSAKSCSPDPETAPQNNQYNRLTAHLRISASLAQQRLSKRPSASLPQSACGLCSFEELASKEFMLEWARNLSPDKIPEMCPAPSWEAENGGLPQGFSNMLGELAVPGSVFVRTGAAHACAVFAHSGRLVAVCEDVGRHNACDKALGQLLLKSRLPRFRLEPGQGLLFSSRLSFELAAKAVRAGTSWMASVGAPTELAVQLAQRCQIPIWGFVGKDRANRYWP